MTPAEAGAASDSASSLVLASVSFKDDPTVEEAASEKKSSKGDGDLSDVCLRGDR